MSAFSGALIVKISKPNPKGVSAEGTLVDQSSTYTLRIKSFVCCAFISFPCAPLVDVACKYIWFILALHKLTKKIRFLFNGCNFLICGQI